MVASVYRLPKITLIHGLVALVVLGIGLFWSPLVAEASDDESTGVRLVLQITVDGLRADRLGRDAATFGGGGFRYLLDQGAVFTNAHYEHANTETIVGHATLATGAHPSVHGMTGNVWYDSTTDELSYNIEDPEHLPLPTRQEQQVGEQVDPAQQLARTPGRSPRALLAETLADKMLAFSGGKAKVFAVSGKDRSAVAMAGHGGKAFWMSTDTGDFVTTTYYYDDYPQWIDEWNGARHAEQLAGKQWSLADPLDTYKMAHLDDRPYETDLRGFGRVFPHRFGQADDKLLFTQVLASPYGDALLADLAQSLIENEDLGRDEVVDYLSVSFSGVDAVNHFFGPASLEAEAMLRRLDRTLADFLDFVDQQIGLNRTVIVLSADHGIAEAPEYMRSLGFPADRLLPAAIIDAANALGAELFGLDEIVKFYYRPYLYLQADRIAAVGLDIETVRNVLARGLAAQAGIHAAVTPGKLEAMADRSLARRVRNNFHAARAGDIYIVQDPYWFNFDPGPVAVMHGSPWSYDAHVPVIFAGPGVKPTRIHRRIQPVDVAPTLAALLGMSPPAMAQGLVLPEVFDH